MSSLMLKLYDGTGGAVSLLKVVHRLRSFSSARSLRSTLFLLQAQHSAETYVDRFGRIPNVFEKNTVLHINGLACS